MANPRPTVVVHAPARLVCGAVIEFAARYAEVVDVHETGMTAVLGDSTFTAECTQTADGTLLALSGDHGGEPDLAALAARAEALVDAEVVVGTAIVRDGRLLAQQRGFPPDIAGLWELPGGRVEPGERDRDAVQRECAEELGVQVEAGDPAGPDVILPTGRLLRIYQASTDGEPVAVEHKAVRWLSAGQLADVEWLPADRLLLPVFRALVGW